MKNYIYDKKSIITSIVIKSVAIISAVYGLTAGIGEAKDLTYFTNLSNILITLALLLFLVFDIILVISDGKTNYKTNYLFTVKFALTLCITLTWLIYTCILAPTSDVGFFKAFAGNHYGSLCLHMITPVLSIIDFIFFDYNYKSTSIHGAYAMVPPLAYVAFIIILASQGVRWGNDMYAPYNFLNFGAPTGWFGFDLSSINSTSLGIGVLYMIFALVLIFYGIGRLFLLFNSLVRKKKMA